MTDARDALASKLREKIERESMTARLKEASRLYRSKSKGSREASEELCELIRTAAAEPYSIPKIQIARLTGLDRRGEVYPALRGENKIVYRKGNKNG